LPETNKLIALDADGVLVNYHAGYRLAWQRAFGELPEVCDPQAYSAMDRYGLPFLGEDKLHQFRAAMDESIWSSLPPLDGAVEACANLHAAGFELVCVSAIKEQYRDARVQNLADIGFPLTEVYAAPPQHTDTVSPKAAVLETLKPIAFVDDFAPYLQGVSDDIHKALILREPNGSPNTGDVLKLANSTHENLLAFSQYWLSEHA